VVVESVARVPEDSIKPLLFIMRELFLNQYNMVQHWLLHEELEERGFKEGGGVLPQFRGADQLFVAAMLALDHLLAPRADTRRRGAEVPLFVRIPAVSPLEIVGKPALAYILPEFEDNLEEAVEGRRRRRSP